MKANISILFAIALLLCCKNHAQSSKNIKNKKPIAERKHEIKGDLSMVFAPAGYGSLNAEYEYLHKAKKSIGGRLEFITAYLDLYLIAPALVGFHRWYFGNDSNQHKGFFIDGGLKAMRGHDDPSSIPSNNTFTDFGIETTFGVKLIGKSGLLLQLQLGASGQFRFSKYSPKVLPVLRAYVGYRF